MNSASYFFCVQVLTVLRRFTVPEGLPVPVRRAWDGLIRELSAALREGTY